MARFERSRERKDSSPRRGNRRTFRDGPKRDRSSGRESNYGRRESNRGGRRELEMTKVICSDCGKECEVPFKPTSSKPVYCSDCFSKHKGSSDKFSNRDFDMINEKLDKIMKALKIE